ncbi:hypothetical protein HK101_008735 [Irineochytrium annulatum]|nr:hypothetical protein HK101_008735 [Irineochytrium annulatum]
MEILRATACCLELLQAMRACYVDLRPSHPHASGNGMDDHEGKQQLSIHIGMGVGDMYRIHVGEAATKQDEQDEKKATRPRREFFIAGEAVVNAGEMEGAAKRGELAIPDVARRALRAVLGTTYPFQSAWMGGPTIFSDSDDLAGVLEKLHVATAPCSGTSIMDLEGCLPDPPAHQSPEFLRALTYVDESLGLYLSKQDPARRRQSSLSGRPQLGPIARSRSAATIRSPDSVDNGVNQLRNVSIVFVRLAGLPVARMNESETLSLVQQIFIMIVGCIRRTNGCLRQFACDDKSASALIVFGLSGFAHERGEEVAAMRTAYEISGKLSVMIGNDFGIGVASGVVLYGIVGNENRADGTCLGAAVNLAARFMTHELSKGRVLCDEIVYTKSIEDFDFTRFADVTFKGFAPMPIYAPVRKVKKANGEQPAGRKSDGLRIFGRDAEMGLLQGLVQRWSTGDTVRMAVAGRSGAGKSSISAWLQVFLYQTFGEKLIFGQSYGTDVTQGSPFSGLGRLLLSLSEALDGKNISNLREASVPQGMQYLSGAFNDHLLMPRKASVTSTTTGSVNIRFASSFRNLGVSKDVLKLFLTVMPGLKGREDSEFDEETSFGKETASTISLAVTKALNKLATNGGYAVLLLLDDLQWMDATTLDITLDIVRRCPHVFVALVSRPLEEIPAAMRAPFESLLKADHMTQIILEPLAVESGIDMIRYALQEVVDAGGEVSDEVCNRIYQLAQGNPMVTRLVCEATKSDWKDSAATMSENMGFSNLTLNIPTDYTSAVIAQFDKINPGLQIILKVAAAGGQFFNISEITQVLSLLEEFHGTPEEVYEIIKDDDIFHFVTLADGLSGTCSFSHFLIYQSILKSLVPTFVENVHLTFANYYESILNDENQPLVIPLLVYHLTGITGEIERKRKYIGLAFVGATSSFRVAEALNYHHALAELGPAEDTDLADHILNNYRLLLIYQQGGNKDVVSDLVKDSCRRVGLNFPSQKQKVATIQLILKLYKCCKEIYAERRLWRSTYLAVAKFCQTENDFALSGPNLGAVQMLLVKDDSLFNITVYNSVCPPANIFYFELPLIAYSLMKRLPAIDVKAVDMVDRAREEQFDFTNACLVSVIFNFTLGKFTSVLEALLQADEADVFMHHECAEAARVNRLFSVLAALFVGEFAKTRAVLTAHLQNYTVEDIGVMAYYDNQVHLCALMVQQGEWEATKEMFLQHIRDEWANDPKV